MAPPPPKYTLDDHPHLNASSVRALFEALRKEVLALDPCVGEEVLKLYIACKAETSFLDVVPQAKRLRGRRAPDEGRGSIRDVLAHYGRSWRKLADFSDTDDGYCAP